MVYNYKYTCTIVYMASLIYKSIFERVFVPEQAILVYQFAEQCKVCRSNLRQVVGLFYSLPVPQELVNQFIPGAHERLQTLGG